MSNCNGHRWSKFWWQDWQNDQELRLCSLAAQGLWMRLLCIMHDQNGYLLVAGGRKNPVDLVSGGCGNCRTLAKILLISERQIRKYLDELLLNGVARVTNEGVIYCQRMINDIKAEDVGREAADRRWNGSKPIGSPNGGGNGYANSQPNREPNAKKLEAEEEREEAPLTPHKNGQRQNFRNGFLQVIAEEGMPSQDGADFFGTRRVGHG